MKRMLSTDDLARDDRFVRVRIEDRMFDPRNAMISPEARKRGGFKVRSEERRVGKEC